MAEALSVLCGSFSQRLSCLVGAIDLEDLLWALFHHQAQLQSHQGGIYSDSVLGARHCHFTEEEMEDQE